MKSNLHKPSQKTTFTCSSCKAVFNLLTTMKEENVSVEICSNCHPFYLGKTNMIKISGRAEKLVSKFEAGKSNIEQPVKKAEPKVRKTKKTAKQTLADLK